MGTTHPYLMENSKQVHEWRRRIRAEQGSVDTICGERPGLKRQQCLSLAGWQGNSSTHLNVTKILYFDMCHDAIVLREILEFMLSKYILTEDHRLRSSTHSLFY